MKPKQPVGTRPRGVKAPVGPQIASGRVLPRISEREFQAKIVGSASVLGWWTYHNPDSRRSTAGLPDLLLIRPPRVIWAELKTDKGRVRPEQAAVIDALRQSGQQVFIWRPSDWDAIVEALQEVA